MTEKVKDVHLPIGIALVGMDERSISRMTTIFKMVFKGRCEVAQGNSASLCIIDLDDDQNAWDTFRHQYPDLPAIVMSESPKDIEGTTYVAKPAKLDVLWESIFSVATGLTWVSEMNRQSESATVVSLAVRKESAIVQSASNKMGVSSAAGAMNTRINTAITGKKSVASMNAKDERDIFFNPDDYLLGRIVTAIKENAEHECAIHVKCWRDRRLILLPGQCQAFTDLTDSQLKNLGVATINEEFSVEINSDRGAGKGELSESEISGLRSMSLDYLIWDLALRTSRGRVPEGTSVSSQLYLQCWPNFPRLPSTPHGMRIASLWITNPRTLDDIAVNLGIQQEDVYSFYSAATMIGLAGNATRKVDNLIAPMEVNKNEITRRGLFASILRRISN